MITRFRDNPNLNLKTVKTTSGETEYRRNCRKIKEAYYVIDEQCFEVEGKWYASTSKLITLDYETGKYVLIRTSQLVYGFVGFKADGSANLGYFTENKYKNVLVNIPAHGPIRSISEEFLTKLDCVEDISTGVWHAKCNITAGQIKKFEEIRSRRVFKEKGYNIEDNQEEFIEKVKLYHELPMKISAKATRYGKMLGATTFGCEFETATGYVPDHIQNQTGTIICRDGSIDNAEFVTVPMKNAKGLITLANLCKQLCKRTTVDIRCSFHVHLGTLPDDRLFLVALYALCLRIQDDVFTMFPYYKIEWKSFKKKNYCQKLRKLGIGKLKTDTKEEYETYVNDGYYRLFKWLNEGLDPDDDFNRRNHVHARGYKWERAGRYYWVNFMNMFFSDRKTMEFRIHHATTNSYKVINWIFICNAIVKYAERNTKSILADGSAITLEEVLGFYAKEFKNADGKFLTNYLRAYVKERKDYFAADLGRGDIESRQELLDDKKYTFTFAGVDSLV